MTVRSILPVGPAQAMTPEEIEALRLLVDVDDAAPSQEGVDGDACPECGLDFNIGSCESCRKLRAAFDACVSIRVQWPLYVQTRTILDLYDQNREHVALLSEAYSLLCQVLILHPDVGDTEFRQKAEVVVKQIYQIKRGRQTP